MDKIVFEEYLKFFPEIELPLTLREDTYQSMSENTPPLPWSLIENFILSDDEEDDGMTEFIPLFRLPNTTDYYALVYWKAGLMAYEYILATYTKDGAGMIDSHTIAGTVVQGKQLVQSIAMIGADQSIYIATGEINDDSYDLDTSKNRTRTVEINDDGTIDI